MHSDAVANPVTVMVHAHDAAAALGAVVRAHGLDCFAVLAHVSKYVLQDLDLVVGEHAEPAPVIDQVNALRL